MYMKHLIPNLLSAAYTTNLKCDTCILTKSHRVSYVVSVTWLYLLKYKGEILAIFKSFQSIIQTQFLATMKVLRFNNSGEYDNQLFQECVNINGLIHNTSCTQKPQ